jgi:hypothetical protein
MITNTRILLIFIKKNTRMNNYFIVDGAPIEYCDGDGGERERERERGRERERERERVKFINYKKNIT